VLELAPGIGYRIIEAELTLEMLTQATEAFLTNAVSGVQPLTQVEGHPIGSGLAGSMTHNINNAYLECLIREIRG
jgi:branched-subunit amino acid aminotransferase/4-amino-4-deoxychorismate lyase